MTKEEKQLIKARNSFTKRELRKSSLKWKPRYEAIKKARKQRGEYQCNNCKGLFERKQLHLDHIDPVIELAGESKQENGEYDWNKYIPRLFCSTNNFQLLCAKCHEVKSSVETDLRTFNKKTKNANKRKK